MLQKFRLRIPLSATEYHWYKTAVSLLKENPFASINRVRHQKLIVQPNVTVEPVLRTSIASSRGRRLSLSAFPLKRAPREQRNNKIERAKSFLPIILTQE